MTDLPGTITALATLVAAIAAALIAWRNSFKANDAKNSAASASNDAAAAKQAAEGSKLAAEESKAEIVATKEGVFEVGKRLDGRLQKLLDLTEEVAFAKGRAEGRAAERADPTKPKDPPHPKR